MTKYHIIASSAQLDLIRAGMRALLMHLGHTLSDCEREEADAILSMAAPDSMQQAEGLINDWTA